MYTELERFIAIRRIIEEYKETQKAKYNSEEKCLIGIKKIGIENTSYVNALIEGIEDLQHAQKEYCYADAISKEMDEILKKLDTMGKSNLDEICDELRKHEQEAAYSYILTSVAYKMYINCWFPLPIIATEKTLILENQTNAIFASSYMKREEKVYYDVLQLALAKLPESKERAKGRRYTKIG